MNTVELPPSDGQVLSVSVLHHRAELVRSYKFGIKKGQNQAHIQWLPWVMDTDSFRVEGRGKATILDVKLLENPAQSQPSSPQLEALELKKTHIEKALERCKDSIASLKSFLRSLNTQHTNASDLASVLSNYETAASQQDAKLVELEQQTKDVNKEISVEKKNISPKDATERGRQAFIGLVADEDTDVELILKYAVRSANWTASYDIRVDTTLQEKSVTLVYKTNISQNTNESWNDVPLTLETITPTYGVTLPSLTQWNVSGHIPRPGAQAKIALAAVSTAEEMAEESDDDMGFGLFNGDSDVELEPAVAAVVSKGALSATFRVPGLVTIPPTNDQQTFTIVELKLDSLMQWFSIPKVDARVHLKAKINNTSEFILVPGDANIYVDGSFVSKSRVPLVSPLEHFDCALGVDPSVRITYHPVEKNISTSGFYNKTTTHAYTQRLTVENTRTNNVPLLKIVDHIPVSDNSQVTVKLLSPALNSSAGSGSGSGNASTNPRNSTISPATKGKAPAEPQSTLTTLLSKSTGPTAKVSEGVYVQWDGADETNVDVEALGKNGKVNWVCDVRPQDKLNLALRWEVSASPKVKVTGL
ncbi:hypothetical protein V5O48_004135 [Marasmius crinis-equi]|uniref:Mucoidy inhibitor A n=1 Tax=Marasmius crinis-equi TaxID=585013 RepID=A0ABR3FQY2_9AGAR